MVSSQADVFKFQVTCSAFKIRDAAHWHGFKGQLFLGRCSLHPALTAYCRRLLLLFRHLFREHLKPSTSSHHRSIVIQGN